jgi:hypothetical protein
VDGSKGTAGGVASAFVVGVGGAPKGIAGGRLAAESPALPDSRPQAKSARASAGRREDVLTPSPA